MVSQAYAAALHWLLRVSVEKVVIIPETQMPRKMNLDLDGETSSQ